MDESLKKLPDANRRKAGINQTIFSFVIDTDPRFAYQGWHLARSLIEHCGAEASSIHVQCTPEVNEHTRDVFRGCGYHIHQIDRFGDGRHCNKLNQLESLRDVSFDHVMLLDTDMIAVADIRPFLSEDVISGVIVGYPNPPLTTLQEIAAAAGLTKLPPVCPTAVGGKDTYLANCNGGLYSVPKQYCDILSREWRRWALWLLDNIEPLRRIGRQNHVDQVSFWLATQHQKLPFVIAPSNVNYHIHIDGKHFHLDETRDIALLHYHGQLNVIGLLEIPPGRSPTEAAAVGRANKQIRRGFNNRVFWDMRYRHFPERGSGVGSRGENLSYKRDLLKQQGIETASSVLDVGCGDLEVVKNLNINRYIGIDQSQDSLRLARLARPDWEFHNEITADIPAAQMVLCFEVLIHQETEAAYQKLIAFLADKTLGSLLVSGFTADFESFRQNGMVFFHEPIENSLRRTSHFRNIQQIGKHTSVVIYRCDV